jgi:hypothetical protein
MWPTRRTPRHKLNSVCPTGAHWVLLRQHFTGLHKSTFPTEFLAGVLGERLIWHKARPESPVPGEAPLAILAFTAGHSRVT